MKIRIKGNSLRYRLTRTDVADLAKKGYLEEVINFEGQSLIYSIQTAVNEELSASYINNKISLLMPEYMIAELADTNRIGFENNKGQLHLLVEKDFTCLDNVEEDQSDNYPNPLAEEKV